METRARIQGRDRADTRAIRKAVGSFADNYLDGRGSRKGSRREIIAWCQGQTWDLDDVFEKTSVSVEDAIQLIVDRVQELQEG